jgi:hypothetical protein
MSRFGSWHGILAAALLVAVSACSENDDPTDVGDGSDFEGFWTLTVDVTETSGVCVGEEDDPPSVREALITQEGAAITATAIWTDESGSVSLTGTRTGDQITFGGSYAEDGGTTSALYTLRIGEGTLNGTEVWSWTGTGGTCPTGLSTVTGVPR